RRHRNTPISQTEMGQIGDLPYAQPDAASVAMTGRRLAARLCAAALLLASCAQPQLAATPAPVVLHLAGSTSMQPLLGDLAAAYSQRYPNVSFDLASMGSTAGLEVLRRGNADVALVSRELLPEEGVDAASGKPLLAYTVIAEDAIAVIVNERNP